MSDLAIAGFSSLTAGDEEQLVTMTVDNQLFGIPILQVQDIVEPQQITPVPLASSAIAGVLNLRGRIVTVIDLRVCLGAEPKNLEDRPMSVTVEYKGDLYTILVDSIGDVRSLPRRDLDKPPQTLDPRMRRLCSGVFRLQDDLLAVLDVDRVLDPSTIDEAPKRRPLNRVKKSPAGKTETTRTDKKKSAKKDAKSDSEDGAAAAKKSQTDKKSSAAKPAAKSAEGSSSLFKRMGGETSVDAAVDLFLEKAGADDRLTDLLAGADAKQLKTFATKMLGGASAYTGPAPKKVYETLVREKDMDDGHVIAFAGYLADTLNQMGLPPELIDEVMTAADNLRSEVS